jgi:GAF domain-containing protein
VANAANTTALLLQLLPDINWAGFYIAEGTELVLGPFHGKPARSRVPFGKGVTGTAALRSRTIVAPDLAKFPGNIVRDPDSRSEIVVPLLSWSKLLGVIDVASASPSRFDSEDQEGLESVAAVFLASLTGTELPDFSEESALS